MQTIAKSRFPPPHKQQDFLEINHSIFAKKIPTKILQDNTYPHHCYRIFTVIDRTINKTRNKDKNIYTPICKKKITKKKINIFYKRFAHIKKK